MSNAFANILAAVSKMKEGSGGSYKDEKDKYWSCEQDKAGNGQATIRFLPALSDDGVPFVRKYSHGFKIGGKWYIDDCRTTIGETCPVCEANSVLWDTGIKENQEIVRQRKRKLSFISLVYIVSDPKNPENEGKVFLFKYGKKIFDKIMDKMQPQFDDEEAVNPFDLETGCDFRLKIRKVEGFANYDKSEFAPVKNRNDEVRPIMDAGVEDIAVLVLPEKFTAYDAQKKRLNGVLNALAGATKPEEDSDADFVRKAKAATAKPAFDEDDIPFDTTPQKPKAPVKAAAPVDDDSYMEFFRNLANED
jgi:hypothetical protein